MRLQGVAFRVVSHPRVNRLQTAILGRHKLEARLRPVAERSTNGETLGTVVDIGGGTARSRAMWPASWTYYSIDPDDRVLAVDEQEAPIERIVGDAARLPLHDAIADVVLMQCVSHHLDAETWQRSLVEAERILKPEGSFIFLDGVWSKRRWVSRWFWRLDAGRFPRESAVLEDALRSRFSIVETERFALVHDSILVTARHA